MKKYRFGVSRCLLGVCCRYDGGCKRNPAVCALPFEWVSVCPESDCGLGIPREPMHVEEGRLIANETRRDLTARLEIWAERKVEELAAASLDGFILKARSPSCDPLIGLFALALKQACPEIPVWNEENLESLKKDIF